MSISGIPTGELTAAVEELSTRRRQWDLRDQRVEVISNESSQRSEDLENVYGFVLIRMDISYIITYSII